MSEMRKTSNVKHQYTDDQNLSVRLNFHTKYTSNPYDFPTWLFDHYVFFEGCRILELGCGTGGALEGKVQRLPKGSSLLMSDFSNGMVDIVRKKYDGCQNVSVMQIDIQNIPLADNSYDIIIANHMLYHIPDLTKALSEVYRVLKPNGVFYASTNSCKGMSEYLHRALLDFNPKLDAFNAEGIAFTIENGEDILKQFFKHVQLHKYTDLSKVTQTQDLIDWIESTISITTVSKDDLTGLYDYFEKIRLKEGSINIPKLAGLFISTKDV